MSDSAEPQAIYAEMRDKAMEPSHKAYLDFMASLTPMQIDWLKTWATRLDNADMAWATLSVCATLFHGVLLNIPDGGARCDYKALGDHFVDMVRRRATDPREGYKFHLPRKLHS